MATLQETGSCLRRKRDRARLKRVDFGFVLQKPQKAIKFFAFIPIDQQIKGVPGAIKRALRMHKVILYVQPLPTPPLPAKAFSFLSPPYMAPDLLFYPVFDEVEALAGMSDREVVSLHPAIQATGRLTFAPAGLIPAEHTSLRWTHKQSQFRLKGTCRAEGLLLLSLFVSLRLAKSNAFSPPLMSMNSMPADSKLTLYSLPVSRRTLASFGKIELAATRRGNASNLDKGRPAHVGLAGRAVNNVLKYNYEENQP